MRPGWVGSHGTGEQHPGTRAEVLVDQAEQRAADCRAADEDEQVYTHDPAADRSGAAVCTVEFVVVSRSSVHAPIGSRNTQ